MSTDENIKSLLSEATKFYVTKDFERSTNLYSELNELHNALTGENNADYLYLYGKSLYQLALSQSEVLGGSAREKEDLSEEEEEEEETAEQNRHLYQFNEILAEEEEEDAKAGIDEQESEENVQQAGEPEAASANEDEEQSDDFESAWEILDLARAMYEKHGNDTETLKKLSETYDILGEISLETENFSQAREDFQQCLGLRMRLYNDEDPTNRLIIESYYKLSLALEFDPLEIEACKENLQSAIQLLKTRIDEKGPQDGDKDLLQELNSKLKELETSENPLELLKNESLLQIKQALSDTASAPTKVNDLTSMVKKRKPNSDRNADGKKRPKKD